MAGFGIQDVKTEDERTKSSMSRRATDPAGGISGN